MWLLPINLLNYPRTAILRPPAAVAIFKKENIHRVEYQVPLRLSCHLISMIQPPVLSGFFFFSFFICLFIFYCYGDSPVFLSRASEKCTKQSVNGLRISPSRVCEGTPGYYSGHRAATEPFLTFSQFSSFLVEYS